MTSSVSLSPIGILGLGFLGKILASDFADIHKSWGTWNKNPPPEAALKVFPFDWSRETSWSALPEVPETLVLTIPPMLNDPEAEKVRLNQWGKWMNKNRPNIKRMIYISSTGVYPKRNGLWHEDSEIEPDTNSGKLRLITEKSLGSFFKQKTAYEILSGLVGSEMCIRDRIYECRQNQKQGFFPGNPDRVSRLETKKQTMSYFVSQA